MSGVKYQVYQIDFTAVSAGKHVASTKRRIRWRFGFPNKEALQDGQTGQACRGEEHEVVIVWSLTSGKRQIVMDGKEVHFATNLTRVLEHSWTSRGNHVYKVVCHATPPVQAAPGFRQYDLSVDGQSFFSMPKVYELGLRGGGGTSNARTAGAGVAPPKKDFGGPRSQSEEEADLQKAIQASLAESKQHLQRNAPPAPVPVPVAASPATDDMMSLGMGDPTDTYAQPYAQPPASYAAYYQQQSDAYQQPSTQPAYPASNATAASYPALPAPAASYPAPTSYQVPTPSYAPTPAVDQYSNYPAPAASVSGYQTTYAQDNFTDNFTTATAPASFDAFGGAAPVDDPFTPKAPTHGDIASDIMSAYGPKTSSAPAPPPYTAQNGEAHLSQKNDQGLSMLKFEEEEPENPFDAALKLLVNIDNVDQPAPKDLKSNNKEKEETEKAKLKGKSKGLPPVGGNVVGNQATLSQIGGIKGQKEPPKNVMNTPPQLFNPQAQQAGMMVVYGDSSQQAGPPPIQRGGFGVNYNRGY